MLRHPTPRGFTIIEVMMFLAITGLMMAGVLVAVTGSINRQRYQDATATVTDFFQGQYNLVDNVYTNRPSTLACSNSGISEGGSQPRGTSDCTIIGRYVTTTDGQVIVSRPVYAQADVVALSRQEHQSEAEYIENLSLITTSVYDGDDTQLTVPWGTNIYTDKLDPSASRHLTMVLVKLPTSGLTRTYIVPRGDQTIATTIADSTNQPFTVCVARDGLVSSPATGAKLLPYAANASGVQPILGNDGDCS